MLGLWLDFFVIKSTCLIHSKEMTKYNINIYLIRRDFEIYLKKLLVSFIKKSINASSLQIWSEIECTFCIIIYIESSINSNIRIPYFIELHDFHHYQSYIKWKLWNTFAIICKISETKKWGENLWWSCNMSR